MKKFTSGTFAACVLLSGIFTTSEAALVSTLNGAGVYDDDLNITWLSNANLAMTNDFGVAGVNADGTMSWSTANDWIAAMNSASYLGFNNWRLPETLTVANAGCSGFNCSGSEMGHLFYNELGGTQNSPVSSSGDPDLSLFTNIEDDESTPPPTSSYWSSDVDAADNTKAWRFRFGTGSQAAVDKVFNLYAWAVHDGKLNAVPVPAAVWLFASGLLGLVGLSRRRTV